MCGGQPSKFMCRSLLEQNFSSDFPLIKLGNIKDVVVDVLDQRSCGGEFVAVVSLFGVEITKQRNSEKIKTAKRSTKTPCMSPPYIEY